MTNSATDTPEITGNEWWIYRGNNSQYATPPKLPDAPKWRRFRGQPLPPRALPEEPDPQRGANYQPSDKERALVNTAIFLRRPLLITGKPGIGKSTLAYSIAYELNLGLVLRWSITTRATLQDGLYRYDALGRLQEASLSATTPQIGRFIRLGPLGTALLPATHPRVLLIDEIDKSDIDLPNDLLHVLEEGEFEIPELARLAVTHYTDAPVVEQVQPADGTVTVPVVDGRVRCAEFPIVVMTSNGEREFPPAFLRRCVRLTIKPPGPDELAKIVDARLDLNEQQRHIAGKLIAQFVARRDGGDQQELSTDQLLNAVHMITEGVNPLERAELLDLLLRPLNSVDEQYQE